MKSAAVCVLFALATTLGDGIATAQPDPVPTPSPKVPTPSQKVPTPAPKEPTPAPQKPSKRDVAQAHLDRGTKLYSEDANFIAALEAFRSSYEALPSWEALNGIAVTLMDMDKSAEAYKTIQKMLKDFDAVLDAEKKETAAGFLKDLEPRIARVVVKLSAENRDAQVTLDGGELAESEFGVPQLLDPGPRALVATLEGFEPYAEKIDAVAGETVTVSIEMVVKKERIVVEVKEKKLVRRMPRWIPWATLAGGAVLAGAGGIFALSAKSSFENFDDAIAEDAGGFPSSVSADESDRDSAETKKLVATGLFVGAGAAVAAGVVLVVLNQPRAAPDKSADEEPATMLILTPRTIGVAVRF